MLKNNKLNLLISIVCAIVLWAYITTVVNPETQRTISGIQVDLTNIEALNYRGFTINEGVPYRVDVTVKGARSDSDAAKLVKGVVSSSLFKAMIFGEDANWGRVMCAMGYSGGSFDTSNVDIDFHSAKGLLHLMKNGAPVLFDEEKAKAVLGEKEIFVDITLFEGSGTATAWGCDLTYDYVKINGDYRS